MSKYICVLDFEANCAEDLKASKMDNEIIEFPSVLWKYEDKTLDILSPTEIGAKTMTKIAEFQMFCKPKNTPILTDFCKDLTKINQEQVDNGISFYEALKHHEKWLKINISNFDTEVANGNVIVATCGHWDLAVMAPKEYKNYNIVDMHDIYLRYTNVKDECYTFYNHDSKYDYKYGMDWMLKYLGLTLEGTHHSGIDDCRNISKILIKMFQDGYKYEQLKINHVVLSKKLTKSIEEFKSSNLKLL